MRNSDNAGYRLAGILTVAILIQASAASTETGELRIEGKHIERLVLIDRRGTKRVFSEPGAGVVLPAGDYHLHEVALQGGHTCRADQAPADLQVTVRPDVVAALKVGAPLRHGVKIKRQGPVMTLDYELIGQGNERYSMNPTGNDRGPSFAVYKGDEKVAAGDFEFG